MTRSVVDDLDAAARAGTGSLHLPAGPTTIGELWRRSHGRAGWLASERRWSTVVAGVLEPTVDSLATLFGTWLAGRSFVSLPRPARGMTPEGYRAQIAHMLEVVGTDEVVLPEDVHGILELPGAVRYEDLGEAAGASGSGEGHLIQFTSGTNGQPRAITLSMRAIGANVEGTAERLGYRGGDAFFSWLPLSHDMGLIGMCVGPLAAMSPELGDARSLSLSTPDAFVRTPTSWLQTWSDVGGTVTMVPNFGLEIALRKLPRMRGLDLSTLRSLTIGSDTVRPATLDAFAAAAAPFGFRPEAMCPGYGLAEATLVVTIESPDEPWATADSPDTGVPSVRLGVPIDGVEMRVEPTDAGSLVGEVLVRSASVAREYRGGPSPVDADGWLHTGDLGFLVDGALHFASRISERIVVGGRTLGATEMDDRLGETPGVRTGCCAVIAWGSSGIAVAFEPVELGAEPEVLRERAVQLANLASTAFGIRPRLVVALQRGSLPKTPSGKVARPRLAEMLADPGRSGVQVRVPFGSVEAGALAGDG